MKKNTGSQFIGVQMVDASDGSAFTGTVTNTYTIDGGTQTSGATVTHEGNGAYTMPVSATLSNGDHILFNFIGTGAIPVSLNVYTFFPQTVDNDVRLAANNTLLLDIPTNSEFNARTIVSANYALEATVGALNNVSTADVNAQCDLALSDYDGPTNAEMIARTLLTASYFDPAADTVANVTLVATTTTNTDMVAEAPTVSAIADGVWDEVQSGHVIAGTFGLFLDTEVSGVGGGSLTVQDIVDGVWDELQSAHVISGSFGDFNDIEISSRMAESSIDTTGGAVDTVTAITDTVLTSEILRTATAQGAGTGSNQIQLDAGASSTDGLYDPSQVILTGGLGAGQARNILQYDGTTKIATVDRNWKIVPDATTIFAIKGDAGREHVNEGLIQAGTSSTATLNTLASSDDDAYNGQILFIRSGLGDDQARLIIAYDGTTKIATIDRDWDTTPNTTSAYVMLATSLFSPTQLAATVWDEPLTGATHNTPNSSGKILRELKSAGIISSGMCQATGQTVNNIRLSATDSATDDIFLHDVIQIVSGTNTGFNRIISSYDGTNKDATITPALPFACDNTTEYVIQSAIVHAETSNEGYAQGAVWYDDVNGTAGTELDVNGTQDRPSSSWADVQTIQAAKNLKIAHAATGSTVTLDQAYEDKEIIGINYALVLNGKSINNSFIEGASSVTGEGLSASSSPIFRTCGFGAVTLDPTIINDSSFFGKFTLRTAGFYVISASSSVLPEGVAFEIDYGAALNASNMRLNRWGGGVVEIQNAGAGTGTYTFDMVGDGALDINANCSDTTIISLIGHIDCTNSSAITTILSDANYTLSSVLSDSTAFQGADIAAIKTITDAIPNSGAMTSIAQGTDLATVDTVVDAIKAKTDKLTFTSGNDLDANIQKVNDVTVTGDGESGTEWGPV